MNRIWRQRWRSSLGSIQVGRKFFDGEPQSTRDKLTSENSWHRMCVRCSKKVQMARLATTSEHTNISYIHRYVCLYVGSLLWFCVYFGLTPSENLLLLLLLLSLFSPRSRSSIFFIVVVSFFHCFFDGFFFIWIGPCFCMSQSSYTFTSLPRTLNQWQC